LLLREDARPSAYVSVYAWFLPKAPSGRYALLSIDCHEGRYFLPYSFQSAKHFSALASQVCAAYRQPLI
jgi:hypothetical protein